MECCEKAPLSGAGDLMAKDVEKAEVVNAFFTSALFRTGFQQCQALRQMGKSKEGKLNTWKKVGLENLETN